MVPKESPSMVMSPTAVAHAATDCTSADLVAVKSLKEQDLPTDGVAVVKVESGVSIETKSQKVGKSQLDKESQNAIVQNFAKFCKMNNELRKPLRSRNARVPRNSNPKRIVGQKGLPRQTKIPVEPECPRNQPPLERLLTIG